MRQVRLYIAVSLDGKIAKPDGDVKWLESIPNPEGTDHGYAGFIAGIDTTLMGYQTYHEVMGFGIPFPYKGLSNYVFTRKTDRQPDEQVTFIPEDPVSFVRKLKAQPGKDIWLIGGGQINTLLLNARLVDDLMIFVMPYILGAGIPLFAPDPIEQPLMLTGTRRYDSGVVLLQYGMP